MIFLYILLALIGLLVVLAIIAPQKYNVQRSTVINKPLPEVFNYLKYVKNQNEWSPWKKKDPNMKQEYIGTDGELGFVSKWEGNKNVGMGEQEIIKIEDNKQIETELRFLKPWKSVSTGYLIVDELSKTETKVTWGFAGKNPIPFNIFMLFFNFEKAVGKDFDQGLSELESILSSR